VTDRTRRPAAATRRATSAALADQRDKVVREQLEKERAASAAKTAKLRALRLAKEAADKETQARLAAEDPDATEAEEPPRKRVFRF
jgi:hypothetical protein